jgi:PcaR/PcaU/PobR family beta-ketoadipate pathway transcriptional regulator
MNETKYTIDTLLRALKILSLFSHETPSLTLTEIVEATGINKTTVFRIVNTFEDTGFLVRNAETKRYQPGVKVLQLGFTAISSLDLRQVARPYLEGLSQEVGETVSLSVLDGMEVIYIDRVRNRQIVGVVLGLGSRLPAHCASMGKAMLAYLPSEELNRRLSETSLVPCTHKSLVGREAFQAELERVRQQGYAINDEELEIGLRAVAAPIWNDQNQVVAAANITGSAAMISQERLVNELAPAVRSTTLQISQALGYTLERRAEFGS